MAVKGGTKCIKYLLFIFNFIFWLAGTAILAIGLWLRFDTKTKSLFEVDPNSSSFYIGVYMLIGAGALIMVVGFLGCCGAIQESQCMLGLFFAFLLVIFAIVAAAGIWGFVQKDQVVQELTNIYTDTYKQYQTNREESVKETLKGLQFALNCCGMTGTLDQLLTDTCPKQEGLNFIVKSCPAAIEELFKSKPYIIGAIGIGLAVIMIFGMIFSMVLCSAIRNNREMV